MCVSGRCGVCVSSLSSGLVAFGTLPEAPGLRSNWFGRTGRSRFPDPVSSWSKTPVVPPFYAHARIYATYLVNPT